jgi:hypothetical protein
MAVSSRTFPRQRDYSKLFISLAVLAAVVAIAPIVAALLGYSSKAVTPKTAFASAPGGDYAVVGRTENGADVISVAWADNPGAVTEITRVPHLEGFASTGAVSPDGKQLALVVVDGGSATHPKGSLKVIGLESGLITNVMTDVAPGQTPVWEADGSRIVAVLNPATDGAFHVVSATPDGKETKQVDAFTGVLGIYPVGFSHGALALVIIDGRGSTLRMAGKDWGNLAAGITRDWKLSPDGSQLAFIETATDGGVRYVARTVSLASAGVSAQSLAAPASALGAAWNPKTAQPMFGLEPGASEVAGVDVQALAATAGASDEGGFDVPMGYSSDGEHLFVTRWSGASFQEPGKPVLQIVSANGRADYDTFTRFYGWAAR